MELICYLSSEDVARAVSASVARGALTPSVSLTDAGAQTSYSRADIEVALGSHLAEHERLDASGAYTWQPDGVYVTVRRQPQLATPAPPTPVPIRPTDRAAPVTYGHPPATPTLTSPRAPEFAHELAHEPAPPVSPASVSLAQAMFLEGATGATGATGAGPQVVAPELGSAPASAWEPPQTSGRTGPAYAGSEALTEAPIPSDVPPRPGGGGLDADAATRAAWLALVDVHRRGGMGLGPVREGEADHRGRDLKVQLGLLPRPTDPLASDLPPVSSIVARLRGAP